MFFVEAASWVVVRTEKSAHQLGLLNLNKPNQVFHFLTERGLTMKTKFLTVLLGAAAFGFAGYGVYNSMATDAVAVVDFNKEDSLTFESFLLSNKIYVYRLSNSSLINPSSSKIFTIPE